MFFMMLIMFVQEHITQRGCPILGLGGWVLGFSLGFFSMKISVTLWFLILAVICFGLFALFPKHPWYLFLLGWAMLDCVYLIVLRRVAHP